MGLPLDELELFLELKDGIIRPDASDPPEQIRIRRETGQRSYATFERALEERAHKPGDDLLRFETPVVSLARIVRQDTTLRGVELKAGEPATLLVGAANADEEEFPGADAVDLGRERNRHLAFGGGPHRCLGSHLARLELRVALEEWHRRIPEYAIAPRGEPRYGLGIREVQHLPLVFPRRAAAA
jgi:cytochrome P450